MGVTSICKPAPIPYITEGMVISVYFRDEYGQNPKKISIHDENTLKKAIEMYQEQINKSGLSVRKAIYEPDQTTLPLGKKLKDLEINFLNTIIVYFCG